MTFKVRSREADEYGEHPLIRVKSVVEDLSGDILIDHPNNKSGRKSLSEYLFLIQKHSLFIGINTPNMLMRTQETTSFQNRSYG